MDSSQPLLNQLIDHQTALRDCRLCADMIPPVIIGQPVMSPIMTIGQAPGIHEGKVLKPFGWTAGKTLFKWFASIGVEEAVFRERVYMSAVCRCFPGKKVSKSGKVGGDRVPNKEEIARCSQWVGHEIDLLKPQLIIPIGKLAILQFMQAKTLAEVVGQTHRIDVQGRDTAFVTDVIPLPHPSGLSTWQHTEPGKTLLQDALQQIKHHRAWQQITT